MGLFCRIIEPQLTAFEAGWLPEWRRGAVAQHLSGCERCREQWERQANLSALLRDHVPVAAEPPADLWARLQPQLAVRAAPVRRRPLWLAPVAGAGFCALLGVSYAARTGWLPLGAPIKEPVPVVLAARKFVPPVPATPAPRGKEIAAGIEKDVYIGVYGDRDPFEGQSTGIANATPNQPSGTPELDRLVKRNQAVVKNPPRKSHRVGPAPTWPRSGEGVATGDDYAQRMEAIAQQRREALRRKLMLKSQLALVPPRTSHNPLDTADVTPNTDLQNSGGGADAPPMIKNQQGAGRVAGRTMPDDMTGATSAANRPPTEAISLAAYQRGLFR